MRSSRCRSSSFRRGSGTRRRRSTQHYARVMPTKLSRAYTDAQYFQRNLRTIDVLIDQEAVRAGRRGR